MEDKQIQFESRSVDEVWGSPMRLVLNQMKNNNGLTMSTPNFYQGSRHTSNFFYNGGASNEDNGNSLLTPSSTKAIPGSWFCFKCNLYNIPGSTICQCLEKRSPPLVLSEDPSNQDSGYGSLTPSSTKGITSPWFCTRCYRYNSPGSTFCQCLKKRTFPLVISEDSNQDSGYGSLTPSSTKGITSPWFCTRCNRYNSSRSTLCQCLIKPSPSLVSSEVPSNQDSGYGSLTPSSTTPYSGAKLSTNCSWCNKSSSGDVCEPSLGSNDCHCGKMMLARRFSRLNKKFSETQNNANSTSDIFDEEMDTSLYSDESSVKSQGNESGEVSMDFSMPGEEHSIDFKDLPTGSKKLKKDGVKKFNLDKTFRPYVDQYSTEQIIENQKLLSSPFLNELATKKNCQIVDPVLEKKLQVLDIYCQLQKSALNFKLKTDIELQQNHFLTEPPVEPQNSSSPPFTNFKKTLTFPSVTKKVVTLNRVVKSFSMNGIEKFDILYQLTSNRLSIPHIVSKVFSYLPEKDLHTVSKVSKSWKELLCNDSSAFKRWLDYKSVMRIQKENLSSPKKQRTPGQQMRVGPLSPLQYVNNRIRLQRSNSSNSPSTSPPVSPQSARFRSFQKAAKKLKPGERLLPCPKCLFASHDHGSPTVQCSRSGCRHQFCVWCRHEIVHGVFHNCPPLYSPKAQHSSSYKIATVGSKSCKRNLRRLTLD